jgi:hypothetical protein
MATRKDVEHLVKERDNLQLALTRLHRAYEELIRENSDLRGQLADLTEPDSSWPSYPPFI